MAKSDLTGLLIFIVVIELAMLIFFNVDTPVTSLFTMIRDGAFSSGSEFFKWITTSFEDVIGIVGLGFIAVGTALATKNDFAIFAGISFVFISYASVFSQLQQRLSDQIDTFFQVTTGAGTLISFLVVLPIVALYIVTILKFWRGTD